MDKATPTLSPARLSETKLWELHALSHVLARRPVQKINGHTGEEETHWEETSQFAPLLFARKIEDALRAEVERLAAQAAPTDACERTIQSLLARMPRIGTVDCEVAIEASLKDRDYPSSSKNAARAGWAAAVKTMAALQSTQAPVQPQAVVPAPGEVLTTIKTWIEANASYVDSGNKRGDKYAIWTDQFQSLADALENIAQMEYPSAHHDGKNLREVAALLRAAAGMDVAGLIERAAKAIYDQWADQNGWVEWVPGGNSMNQDEARRIARAALESALRLVLAQREWRPIETAPKDGRQLILLLTPSGFPQVAYSNTWWTAGFSVECKPTHWMPLPAAAPQAKEQTA